MTDQEIIETLRHIHNDVRVAHHALTHHMNNPGPDDVYKSRIHSGFAEIDLIDLIASIEEDQ